MKALLFALSFCGVACRQPEDRTGSISWQYEWESDDPVQQISEKFHPSALPRHGAVSLPPAIGADSTVYLLRPHDYTPPKGRSLFAVGGTGDWELRFKGGLCNSPAISDDGTIIVGSNDGQAWAISPNGHKNWNHRFLPSSYVRPIDYGGASTPARPPSCTQPAIAKNGTSYWVGNGVFALSSDGVQLWSFQPGTDFLFVCIGKDGTIYALANGGVFAVAPDGTKRWKYDLPESKYSVGDISIGENGMLYVTSLINLHSSLFVLTPKGALQRTFGSSSTEVFAVPGQTLIAADGTIYVTKNVNNRTFAVALDPSGKQKWIGPEESATVAVGGDGALYIRDVRDLVAVAPGGRILWRTQLPENPDQVDAHEPTEALTLGFNGKFLVGDFYGRLGTLDTSAGLAIAGWPARFHDPRNTLRAGAR